MDEFINVSIEVKHCKDIHESLQKFISGDVISDYLCDNCNQKGDLKRHTLIEKLPNVLIVHL